MSNIVGVRYIGSKNRKEDNVLNSGASWVPGQVINFDAASGSRLSEHKDVWELTDVDHDAETKIVSAPKKVAGDPRKHEPATFANVNAMDKDQLHAFARTSLLRQLPDLPLDKLREEVKTLVTMSFLDDQQGLSAASKPGEGRIISLLVSDDEFTAYEAGDLVLKLVPKPSDTDQTSEQTGDNTLVGGLESSTTPAENLTPASTKPTPADLDDALDQLPGEHTAEEVEGVVTQMKGYFGELFTPEVEANVRGLFKPAEHAPASTSTTTPPANPTGNTGSNNADPIAALRADLELLEKKDLRELVKKAGLPVSNVMEKETLIEKLLVAAGKKAE